MANHRESLRALTEDALLHRRAYPVGRGDSAYAVNDRAAPDLSEFVHDRSLRSGAQIAAPIETLFEIELTASGMPGHEYAPTILQALNVPPDVLSMMNSANVGIGPDAPWDPTGILNGGPPSEGEDGGGFPPAGPSPIRGMNNYVYAGLCLAMLKAGYHPLVLDKAMTKKLVDILDGILTGEYSVAGANAAAAAGGLAAAFGFGKIAGLIVAAASLTWLQLWSLKKWIEASDRCRGVVLFVNPNSVGSPQKNPVPVIPLPR